MNVAKKLALWKQNNLISEVQERAILDFEKTESKPFVYYTALVLALFCIALGIVSLVAANWTDIPAFLKLVLDFALLILAAWGINLSRQKNKNIWFESLLVFYAGLIMASIGLIAQIYHLKSDDYTAILVWSILTMPFLFMSKKIILPLVWIPIFIFSFGDVLYNTSFYQYIEKLFIENYSQGMVVSFIALFSLVFLVAQSILRTRNLSLVKALKFWLVFNLSILIVSIDFFSRDLTASHFLKCCNQTGFEETNVNIYYLCLLALVAVIAGLFVLSRKMKLGYSLPAIVSVIFIYTYALNEIELSATALKFFGFVFTLVILLILAYRGYKESNGRLLNTAAGLLAIRIFFLYIQVIGSLAMTGIGLLVSGLVLIGIIYGFKKIKIVNRGLIEEQK